MQISRLFEIVYLLLDKKSVTASELARRFEVSTRTIYRDIDTLSAAGIPVYASKGKGGGIRLTEGFVLNKSLLSETEQNEILTALQALGATHYPGGAEVLDKLGALFQKSAVNWIDVDFSDWGFSDCEAVFPEDEWVYGFILSFGHFAEVLEPIYIREIIKDRTKKILQLYSE